MSHHLKITDEAAERLFEAAKWYAETSQSVRIAATWYDGFLNALESLAKNPWLGGVASENDLFDFELRELHYGSGKRITHRALYRVTGNAIEVLTIRHHAEQPLRPGDLKQTSFDSSDE